MSTLVMDRSIVILLVAYLMICLTRGQQPPPVRPPIQPPAGMMPNQPRPSNPQQPRPPGQTGGSVPNGASCAQAGRVAVAQCFQTNGGFRMQIVVAVLSNGSQSPLPPNADQVRAGICRNQGTIISCIFSNINNFRDSRQCPSSPEFVRLEQETVSLVTGMQQMCGNGPLPPPSTCMKDLNKNMKECYTKVGLNPDLFTPTGSQLQGAVIGENKQMSKKFCGVRTKLFECMGKVMSDCPGSSEVLAMSGYDHESLKKSIDVLCHDVEVYTKGLLCFQTPTPRVQSCVGNMVRNVTDLRAQQLQRTINEQQFHQKFCQIRMQYMDCDLSAWIEQCEEAAIGLKNEFECNLLPTRCKNDQSLQDRLQKTCAVENFKRGLRGGAAQTLPISGLAMTVLSVFVVFLL